MKYEISMNVKQRIESLYEQQTKSKSFFAFIGHLLISGIIMTERKQELDTIRDDEIRALLRKAYE